jgi:hypothetical protein
MYFYRLRDSTETQAIMIHTAKILFKVTNIQY